jgi:uncharacterized membrane protein YfcA
LFDSHLTELVMTAAPIIFLAYLVRGICGFGSGLIAIPVLSLMFPLKVAVPLVVMLDYLASAGHYPVSGWLRIFVRTLCLVGARDAQGVELVGLAGSL